MIEELTSLFSLDPGDTVRRDESLRGWVSQLVAHDVRGAYNYVQLWPRRRRDFCQTRAHTLPMKSDNNYGGFQLFQPPIHLRLQKSRWWNLGLWPLQLPIRHRIYHPIKSQASRTQAPGIFLAQACHCHFPGMICQTIGSNLWVTQNPPHQYPY